MVLQFVSYARLFTLGNDVAKNNCLQLQNDGKSNVYKQRQRYNNILCLLYIFISNHLYKDSLWYSVLFVKYGKNNACLSKLTLLLVVKQVGL